MTTLYKIEGGNVKELAWLVGLFGGPGSPERIKRGVFFC
jgi:hypothetical protein